MYWNGYRSCGKPEGFLYTSWQSFQISPNPRSQPGTRKICFRLSISLKSSAIRLASPCPNFQHRNQKIIESGARIIVRQMGPAEPEAARGCSLYHRSFLKVIFTSWELAHPASSSCRRLPVQHRINIGC